MATVLSREIGKVKSASQVLPERAFPLEIIPEKAKRKGYAQIWYHFSWVVFL
jgi:hypothetical protein